MAKKQYLSKHSGLFVPLPEGLREKHGNFIKFRTASGSIFVTEEKELQELIEGVPKLDKSGNPILANGLVVYAKKPLKYWLKGIIVPLPTAEELEYEKNRKEIEKKRGYIQELLNSGVQLPDETFSDSNVRKYAKSVGVQTSDSDGVKLTKGVILMGIYDVFGLEFKEKKGKTNEK